MPKNRRPSSIDGIKSLAKEIAKARDIIHAKALDEASKLAGFNNYTHALRVLAHREQAQAGLSADERRHLNYHYEARGSWVAACNEINPNGAASLTWEGVSAIRAILSNFMGENNNHVFLPSGGGVDFKSAGPSTERGCVDFSLGDRHSYIAKPKKLCFERIEEREAESFLLLELDELPPSGAYERDEDEDLNDPALARFRMREEVVELYPGEYEERGVWDAGHLGYDENDYEIPLPDSARLVVRWMHGKMLFVCKRGMWNLDNSTYDGRHNGMTAQQIRSVIERSMEEHRKTG